MNDKISLMLEVTGKLREQGIPFEQPNRWLIRFDGISPMIDYWPTTGKYMVVGDPTVRHCSYFTIIKNVKRRNAVTLNMRDLRKNPWRDEELRLMMQFAKREAPIQELYDAIPTRSPKAVKDKLLRQGFRIHDNKIKIRRE